MNNLLNTIAPYFTGKGSTIRLAIIGSLFAGTIYEVIDAKYNISATSNDKSISFAPTDAPIAHSRFSQQLQQESFVSQESGINPSFQLGSELSPEMQQR